MENVESDSKFNNSKLIKSRIQIGCALTPQKSATCTNTSREAAQKLLFRVKVPQKDWKTSELRTQWRTMKGLRFEILKSIPRLSNKRLYRGRNSFSPLCFNSVQWFSQSTIII